MLPKPRTVALILTGAAVAAGLGWIAFREDPVPVDLHVVAAGPMRITIDADGKTRIAHLFEVAAPIDGIAQRSPVAVGDAVVAGETVVATVEPAAAPLLDTRARLQAEAAVREAEAAIAVAEADVTATAEARHYAETQFERTQELVNRGAVSLTRLEDADRALAVARAAHEAAVSRQQMAEGALSRARALLVGPDLAHDHLNGCCVPILAPASGVVLEIDVISERPVRAGERLLTVGDPADLEIVADILSADAVRVPPDARAIVERWGGPDPLTAELVSIEPSARTKVSALGIEEQRVDAVFRILSPPPERQGLGHGFAVFLRIVEWQGDDVLQVPVGAAFRQDGGWAVFRAVDGRAVLTPVTLGRMNGVVAEVTGGLAPGERVITHPADDVTDGGRIAARDGG